MISSVPFFWRGRKECCPGNIVQYHALTRLNCDHDMPVSGRRECLLRTDWFRRIFMPQLRHVQGFFVILIGCHFEIKPRIEQEQLKETKEKILQRQGKKDASDAMLSRSASITPNTGKTLLHKSLLHIPHSLFVCTPHLHTGFGNCPRAFLLLWKNLKIVLDTINLILTKKVIIFNYLGEK